MTAERDYDAEMKDASDHKYFYDFDVDVMHNYMLDSMRPLLRPGNALELGSHTGRFTKRLSAVCDSVVGVEASEKAVVEAEIFCEKELNVEFVADMFDLVDLDMYYPFNNVVMTHVLEHLDEPVEVLKRVNNEWLADDGRLFITVPNANAPSRQIAVKMALIPYNSRVTDAEIEHGHRRTYTQDVLEHHVTRAGLKVIHRSGIFFKAMSNFQYDAAMKAGIIARDYLDGCYKLGQVYPDLCASLFMVCEKG